jgi:hypothetical protein
MNDQYDLSRLFIDINGDLVDKGRAPVAGGNAW